MSADRSFTVFIVGTRAQLIKVAPVIVACERIEQPALLLLTGQHKETMQDLVEEFGICSPQVNAVEVSERSTVVSLARWIPRAYFGLSRCLRTLNKQHPALRIVVHGDTFSTVLGALVARRRGLKVFHLESGLTSGKLFDPFPEELSRRVVFRLTDVAICPGADSAAHMRASYACEVIDSGENTIVDSVMMATQRRADGPTTTSPAEPYFVASIHRFQNIFDGKRFQFLIDFLIELSVKYPVYFVLHPATRKRLERDGMLAKLSSQPGMRVSPRLGYSEFLALAANAACVLTDGGSNQEELAVLGVPTIVMRQRTERPDGLGQNAIMEADIGPDLLSYCQSGDFSALRRESRVGREFGPSALVAAALAAP